MAALAIVLALIAVGGVGRMRLRERLCVARPRNVATSRTVVAREKQPAGVRFWDDKLYASSDIDPLIVGQGKEFRENTRDVYQGRTAYDDRPSSNWGLQEFSSSGGSGDVGVDVGPVAVAEYAGGVRGADDGIPSEWAFPSTPVRWYRPQQGDFLGRHGPQVGVPETLYPTFVPDHEPMI